LINSNKQKDKPSEIVDKTLLIQADNIGLSYNTGLSKDDFQSMVYGVFSLKKRQKRRTWALKDISITGYKGDIIGVVGSNGAGKTTLCRVLSGLLKPDVGTLSIKGKVSALLSVGTGFNLKLSGIENIYLNGMMLGFTKKEIDDLVPSIISFSDIGKFIDQPLKNYSNGMRTRLGFSIAALLNPEIMIIDETLNAGDLNFNEKAGQKMLELVKKSSLVIIVTHQITYVNKYCNKAIWLDQGCIKAHGLPDQVTELYMNSVQNQQKKTTKVIDFLQTKQNTGPNKESVVRVENVSSCYNLKAGVKTKFFENALNDHVFEKEKFWALKNVSFKVNEGDIVGIIGPNGAGKSTLCRLIGGIYKPEKGNIFVKGNVMTLFSFGLGFNNQLSGIDNIYLNGLLLGSSRKSIEKQIENIIDFSGLDEKIHEPVKHYSNGMRARLGFSVAAALKPDIFIIDEALNPGDAAFYEKASVKMQEMIDLSKAVIVVTHSMKFVSKVCSRVLFVHNGILKYDGDPDEAVQLYKDLN